MGHCEAAGFGRAGPRWGCRARGCCPLPPAQVTREINFLGLVVWVAVGGTSSAGFMVGWQAAPGAAVLREQIWSSVDR